MSDFFKQIEVKVPNRSGEDKSFEHTLTTKCGTLTPVFWDEVIPGTKVYLKQAVSASLPPLASDTFMKCRLKTEAFFVPYRQLSASFAPWLTGEKLFDASTGAEVSATLPLARIMPNSGRVGAGTLADFLGYKISALGTSAKAVNIFPFICYHWLWDQMYRNSKIQKRCFSVPANAGGSIVTAHASFLPYVNSSFGAIDLGTGGYESLADGNYLTSLRQRNFDADYFTCMTTNPQSVATPAAVSFSVDLNTGDGSFTIAALRAQNSLQQYLERQNLAGFRLTEYVKANYGVNLAEGMAQMPLFLGRASNEVYSKGVDATSSYDSGNTQNPMAGSPGTRYGSAYALGDNTLIEEFEAKEPGIIMVLSSLVPKVSYSSGIDPLLLHFTSQSSQSDVANPLLQNVGQQAVRQEQLYGNLAVSNDVFGYTDRYSEFMTKVDRVSGLFRDGQSLQSFVLQRSFTGPSGPRLVSAFLEIPTSYLDQVAAVSGTISNYGVMIDCYFEYKISHPLAKYSIPSLQDPAYEHGKGVIIPRTGQIVN